MTGSYRRIVTGTAPGQILGIQLEENFSSLICQYERPTLRLILNNDIGWSENPLQLPDDGEAMLVGWTALSKSPRACHRQLGIIA
jgi:hypothetical protein